MVVLGIFLIICGATFTEESAINLVGYQNYGAVHVLGQSLMIIVGLLLIAGAAVVPFWVASTVKKCFIDVYDDRVRGGYQEGVGQQARTILPFELTYDKIDNVSAEKTTVYIQTAGRTLRSQAFNANEIARAISSRIQVRAAQR